MQRNYDAYCFCQHFPPQDLLSNWNQYFTAFNLYMMHPASTVRQTTSVIFKFIGTCLFVDLKMHIVQAEGGTKKDTIF